MSDPTKAEIKGDIKTTYEILHRLAAKYNLKKFAEDLTKQEKFLQSEIDRLLKDNGHRKL